LARKRVEIADALHLTIDETPVSLSVASQDIRLTPGQNGLSTLQLQLLLRGTFEEAVNLKEQEVFFRDNNYSGRIGWKEIVVNPGKGVSLQKSTVTQRSSSNQLTSYPEDMLRSPLSIREARAVFVQSGSEISGDAEPPASVAKPKFESQSFLDSLVTPENLSLPVVALALLAAMGLGAAHAVSPGHGKAIMAAYLVGTKGTAIHALFLGMTVTVSHTLGVLGLGLVAIYASHFLAPESLYPWLGLVSGATIVAVGAWLFFGRLRPSQADSAHSHGTALVMEAHQHPPKGRSAEKRLPWIRRLRWWSANEPHGHPHSNHHSHGCEGNDGGLRITWKSLTALGIVGGLLPSASALIILLAAISAHRIGFGLLLIFAFSLGMATVLSGIGLLVVCASRMVERVKFHGRLNKGFTGLVPFAAALVVLGTGVVVTARSLFQIGLL